MDGARWRFQLASPPNSRSASTRRTMATGAGQPPAARRRPATWSVETGRFHGRTPASTEGPSLAPASFEAARAKVSNLEKALEVLANVEGLEVDALKYALKKQSGSRLSKCRWTRLANASTRPRSASPRWTSTQQQRQGCSRRHGVVSNACRRTNPPAIARTSRRVAGECDRDRTFSCETASSQRVAELDGRAPSRIPGGDVQRRPHAHGRKIPQVEGRCRTDARNDRRDDAVIRVSSRQARYGLRGVQIGEVTHPATQDSADIGNLSGER